MEKLEAKNIFLNLLDSISMKRKDYEAFIEALETLSK